MLLDEKKKKKQEAVETSLIWFTPRIPTKIKHLLGDFVLLLSSYILLIKTKNIRSMNFPGTRKNKNLSPVGEDVLICIWRVCSVFSLRFSHCFQLSLIYWSLIAGVPEQVVAVEPKCDIFMGNWVPGQSGPVYTNNSCLVIEAHQNCMKNGRPDSGYLYWRWRPQDCELPRFDPRRFLNKMRDKSWAFIGDSISRNHVQSLLCILSQVRRLLQNFIISSSS